MNEHIELVKKFLDDNDSVTEKELWVNKQAAYDAFWAADRADYWAAYEAAFWAAYAAEANYRAADEAAYQWKELAIEAVKEYEKLTK